MNEIRREEIMRLETQLQEKKAQLEKEQGEPVHDKQILHGIVREHIQNEMQSNPEDLLAIPQPQVESTPTELTEALKTLSGIALESPFEAIKAAVKTKNPALLDAFHDQLTDTLYDKLVASKKIDQPK